MLVQTKLFLPAALSSFRSLIHSSAEYLEFLSQESVPYFCLGFLTRLDAFSKDVTTSFGTLEVSSGFFRLMKTGYTPE